MSRIADSSTDNLSESRVMIYRERQRAAFAALLHELMVGRGWHPSELSRRSGVPRDAISTYLRAASIPRDKNLERLAFTFKTTPEALLQMAAERERAKETPAGGPSLESVPAGVALTPIAGSSNRYRLLVNREVSLALGAKIVAMLADDAPSASA